MLSPAAECRIVVSCHSGSRVLSGRPIRQRSRDGKEYIEPGEPSDDYLHKPITVTTRKAFIASLALFTVCLAWASDTRYLQGLGDVRYHRLESVAAGRMYHVYVMLPDGYDASGSDYPTIYLLDGGNLFPMLAPYYRYLRFGEEVPDAILVGISYGSDDFNQGNLRSTDYTAPSVEREYWGGASDFQSFLRSELLPYRRVVFGQSLGGQFVLYTAQTDPGLFRGHIASNPALHRNLEFFLETRPESAAPDSRLFVASGTDDDAEFRDPALEWISHWQETSDKPWKLETVDLEGHSHMSAPPAAFRRGLRWLFAPD